MADILNIGSSALLAAQRGLEVTSHNVANVNTPNYSRQRIEQSARVGRFDSSGGVSVDLTRRLNDALLETRLVRNSSETARLSSFDGLAQRVDSLLSDPDTGLSSSLDGFFSSLSDLAADPTSTAVRQSTLGAAQSLADRFNSLHGELSSLDSEIDQRLRIAVGTLNDQTEALAKLNERIATAGSNASPDLLDSRDKLVQDIAGQLKVSTVQQDDGSLNLYTGSGQPLVVGKTAIPLATNTDSFRPDRIEIAGGSQLSGGVIGGLLDARRELIDPALEKLGRMAVTVSDSVNTIQAQGADLNGNSGAPLFTSIEGQVLAANSNTGSAQVELGIADSGALSGGDYLLRYSGGNWQLSRASTGAAVSLNGSGTAQDPFTAEGLSLVVSGNASEGDRYRLSPTRDASAALKVSLGDAAGLAAASPLSASASLSNTGSAKPGTFSVTDAANSALRSPASIVFTSATTYSVNGGPDQTWSAGDLIGANGWSLNLSGIPAAGDSFSLAPTAAGSGDNRNALALSGLSSQKLLDGGTSSLVSANSNLVTQIGSTAERIGIAKTAAEALQAQAQSERDSLSGVNLDEEAANLIRYQQAYQAAAQVIATASAAFESLLAAARS